MIKQIFMAGILLAFAAGTVRGADNSNIAYSLDFIAGSGSPGSFLNKKGFVLKKDADNLAMSFSRGSLQLTSTTPTFGVIINDKLHIKEFSKIRIEWGILQYPEGASYEKDVNNEAIMIYVFFGDKKLSSDSIFIPDSPYFMGLFLGEHDIPGKVYIGHHFTTGGRFICVGAPKEGETVTTEFDLKPAFMKNFKQTEVPFISGISIEVDTSYLSKGNSTAFIRKIEILK